MEKIKISAPRINIRYVFLVISIFIAISIPVQIFKASNLKGSAFILSIIINIILAVSFYYFFKVNKHQQYFEFDRQFLYKSGCEMEEKIAIENIYAIEKPLLQIGNTFDNWIIRYRDNEGNSNSIKINTSFRKQNFDRFIRAVKSKNPKVKA